MSKPLQSISLVVLLSLSTIFAYGQEIEVTVGIDFKTPAVVSIHGRRTNQSNTWKARNLSFLKSVPGAENLSSRISGMTLLDSAGREVSFRKLQDGEYVTDAEFERWTYKVDLTPPGNRNAAAHSSWFAAGTGILMLADLLPIVERNTSARVTFETPARPDHYAVPIWSSETRKDDVFEISAIEDAIFYVGSWEHGYLLDKPWPAADLLISGTWNFDANDMSPIAREIHDYYSRLLGSNITGKPLIIAIAKFPVQTRPGEWQAETRGRNVTIISSDMPFKTQSLQRLHEQLRHELFHLWIPNGVNLTGNYDWFYEGFALYESLKLAVRLNRIRFDDFLDTLSRAHTIDSAQTMQRTSLIQMSSNRFSGANTQVYARGMLVGFLCDLAFLEQSKGKRSVEDVLRELFAKHRKPAPAVDGNASVLALLKSNRNVIPIVEKYVEGAEKLEWASQLDRAGLEDNDAGPLTSLRVKEKLNSRQKALLDMLGYNNWRKLSPTSK